MAVDLDKNAKIFVVYITTSLATPIIQVHLSRQAHIGLLLTDKVFIEILPKYLNYTNIF